MYTVRVLIDGKIVPDGELKNYVITNSIYKDNMAKIRNRINEENKCINVND